MSKRHNHIDSTIIGHHYRCLTKDEMYYLVWERPASTVNGVQNARWCNAYVNSVRGFILLPDNFVLPSGITMTNINVDRMTSPTNNYTVAQWEILQIAGCVFFAATGVMYPQSNYKYDHINSMVGIWLSTTENACPNMFMCRATTGNHFGIFAYGDRMNRLAVRLFDEDGTNFSISNNKTVDVTRGHLQYHPLDNIWRIAPHGYDYIGVSNKNFTNVEYNGWIDLFSYACSGWSGGPTIYSPVGTWSSSNSNYYIGGDAGQGMLGAYANCDWGVYNNAIIQN